MLRPRQTCPEFIVVRVEIKIHIVKIACWLQLKYVKCSQVFEIPPPPPLDIQSRGGGGARNLCTGPGPTWKKTSQRNSIIMLHELSIDIKLIQMHLLLSLHLQPPSLYKSKVIYVATIRTTI